MCGIVVYFGGAGNGPARVLTGMSAIIYRAPDSTGVGVAGDRLGPIRTRKALGSAVNLIERLADEPLWPDYTQRLAAWVGGDPSLEGRSEAQAKLLAGQGFAPMADQTPPTIDQLVPASPNPQSLAPGTAGRPLAGDVFRIRNRRQLADFLRLAMTEYDLSPVVCQALVRAAIQRSAAQSDFAPDIDHQDLSLAVEEVLDQIFYTDLLRRPPAAGRGPRSVNPRARKIFWRLLVRTPISIPPDFDRDGVRGVFRLLDAALAAQRIESPELEETAGRIMRRLWPDDPCGSCLWSDLYELEKQLNVYGRAAAAAYVFLAERRTGSVRGLDGATDPDTLCGWSSPVLGHGRWALQSAINLENAHPFTDRSGLRALALNGQFSVEVETRIKNFLLTSGFRPRSGNSSEFLALLWGYHFEVLKRAQIEYDLIAAQVEAEFEDLILGAQTIDYRLHRLVRGKSDAELDELAFLTAIRQMVEHGGQVAAAGISLITPDRLYVAQHNRPAFVAARPDGREVMVVSDVNAALGLFSQKRILSESIEAKKGGGGSEASGLAVDVWPLEGEEIYARVETRIGADGVRRRVDLMDFNGEPRHEIEKFRTTLSPLPQRRDRLKGFYLSHLSEAPERLSHAWQTYWRGDQGPVFDLRESHIRHRFGRNLPALRRLVLAGTGAYHRVGLMARPVFERLHPHLDVTVVHPVEIGHIRRALDPDRDLVILLSWSGTSADMVQFAQDLETRGVSMIGLTEKPFSDLGLIVRKSGGVAAVESGEEVTYTSVKTGFSMLFCLNMLALRLAMIRGAPEDLEFWAGQFAAVPGVVGRMLADEQLADFAGQWALDHADAAAVEVVDATMTNGVGLDAADKLTDAAWSVACRGVDYRDFQLPAGENSDVAVLVGATDDDRRSEALEIMKRLYLADRKFTVIGRQGAETEAIGYLSRERSVFLPQVHHLFQPFVDMTFYHLLAHRFSLALGRPAAGFPRNRAKSVTVSRSRPKKMAPPAGELIALGRMIDDLTEPLPENQSPTVWEQRAVADWERAFVRDLIDLVDGLAGPDPESFIFEAPDDLADWASSWCEALEEGEVILYAFDRGARAAAESVAAVWKRFISGTIRVTGRSESPDGPERFSDEAWVLMLASRPPKAADMEHWLTLGGDRLMYVGPFGPPRWASLFQGGRGCRYLGADFGRARPEALWAATHLILIQAFRCRRPERAAALNHIWNAVQRTVAAVTHDADLRQALADCMADNRDYRTADFITGPSGGGLWWQSRFDRAGGLILNQHLYGQGGYGPVTKVDPDLEAKFVRLAPRAQMVDEYGEKRVRAWEDRFLPGHDVDAFRDLALEPPNLGADSPFFAEGAWRLPVLRPDYDPRRDHLIVIDAADDRYGGQVLDVLSTYGCRYARLVVLTQKAFLERQRSRGMFEHPISRLLVLPEIDGPNGPRAILEFAAPLALNLCAAAMAAEAARARGVAAPPPTSTELVQAEFGAVGAELVRQGVGLEQLSHVQIEMLKRITPLIDRVTGLGRYLVRCVDDEDELLALAEDRLLFGASEVIAGFRARQGQDVPLYLVFPDQGGFDGRGAEIAASNFDEDYWRQWFEVYGDTWRGLYYRRVEFRDRPEGIGRVEIPLLSAGGREGRLYHLYVDWKPWRHDAPLAEETDWTARALGRDAPVWQDVSPRYMKVASLVNQEFVSAGELWTDWYLALLPRSMVLGKNSRALAAEIILAVKKIMDRWADRQPGEIGEVLARVWPQTADVEKLTAGPRLRALMDRVDAVLD